MLMSPLINSSAVMNCAASLSYFSSLAWELVYISSSTSIFHSCLGAFHLFHHLILLYLPILRHLVTCNHQPARGEGQQRLLAHTQISVKVSRGNQTHNSVSDPRFNGLSSQTSCTPIARDSLSVFNELW